MNLNSLSLQNFRSYKKRTVLFNPELTIIVGKNTSGKTNLIEALTLLSTGKSFRAEKDFQAIHFGEEVGRIIGKLADDILLEVVLTTGMVMGQKTQMKKFLVNGIAKRRVDFSSHLPTVVFSPEDLDMISGSPGKRRAFLDSVLEQTDKAYLLSTTMYEKALRQRNALLSKVRETGVRNEKEFAYWDSLLIRHGNVITQKRNEFIAYINKEQKDIFKIVLTYDKSTISLERLLQYKDAEVGSGVTLVGPHRDDFIVEMAGEKNVKAFGSRGQQRLSVLQLKLLQLSYMHQFLEQEPLLLLDDIFSELDEGHIGLVQEMIGKQQTIMTTTHKEFLQQRGLKSTIIELNI